MLARVFLPIGFSMVLGSCTAVQGTGIPDVIVAERGGFIPEGIEYDNRNGRLLTGSLSEGTIYSISNSGELTAVAEDPEMPSSVGIEVDEDGNRLLAAVAARGTAAGAAKLGVFDLSSGARLALIDLAATIEDRPADASHFANDVAISQSGTAFVTDTSMNIIYRVDRYYNAEVFLDLGRDSGFSLNGIDYHPNGYLIVAAMGTGELIRVPINSPENWSVIELDFPASGGDGLVWAADGGLVVTSNNTSRVLKYSSNNNWRSASLSGMARFGGQGTTAAAVGNDIYVVQPHFADPEPPVILRAQF
ncbi:MAG: SMP-30/gluconolactonase/LRE family protein [Gammaproteobacteria bacterium]